MAVTLTDRAADHVQRYIAKRGKGIGLRLGVRTTGFESNGVRVLIDPKSLAYLEGTELDFVREGLNEGFKFNNPNEKDRCGCGESFNV